MSNLEYMEGVIYLESVAFFVELISNVGFPIACVVALGYFIFNTFQKFMADSKSNMTAVQDRCKEREEKLYEMLTECRVINEKALETIAHYAERLDVIQADISTIKTDVTTIKAQHH